MKNINWELVAWFLYSIGAYILLIPIVDSFFNFKLCTLSIIIGFFGMLLNAIIQLLNKINDKLK